jgi:hypothetical protein
MIDPRLVPETRRRIGNNDYEAVFAAGGCFLFALRLSERFGYKTRGFRASLDPACWGHVWALHNDKAIDVRGAYPEEFITALANDGVARKAQDVSVEALREAVGKKEYPEDLAQELSALADRIFDTHLRFDVVRPPNPEAIKLFSK